MSDLAVVALWAAFISVFFFGLLYLDFDHRAETGDRAQICKDSGGVPLIGDKGHFKVCLSEWAVVPMDAHP